MHVHKISELWPAMTTSEWEEFRADVGANGLLQPIVTWRDAIVDGKHRALACTETGVPPRYDALPPDWDEQRVWLHCASLHRRRNLDASQRAMVAAMGEALMGARIEARERRIEGNRKGAEVRHGRAPRGAGAEQRASAVAAKALGVGARSVERAAFVAERAPTVAAKVRDGKIALKVAERIAKAPQEQHEALLAQLDTGARSEDAGDSWGTPREWIDLARTIMGGIDLDPASNADAQHIVQAAHYYTVETDGLEQEWHGRVWLNPPYSQPAVQLFAEKLVAELNAGHVTEAIVLVNNATDTRFAQALLGACSAVLFPAGRISFVLPGTDQALTGTRQGQMILYYGPHVTRFASACAGLGWMGTAP